MARAGLLVEDELKQKFISATSRGIRWIKAELSDVNICFSDEGQATDNAAADLESMKTGALEGSTACFVVFSLTPGVDKNGWVLITYVPENSKVRARMLYASGQEDFKVALGQANFSANAHVTVLGELSLDLLHGNTKRDFSNLPLTETEILAKESVAHMASPTDARTNGMGMVPFDFDKDLDDELQKFSSGNCDFVEAMVIGDSEVGLGSTDASSLTAKTITVAEPRFYLARLHPSERKYFVFSCPETTKIKTRMVYSTCKQTMLHHLAELGIEFDKSIEVGDPADIDDLLRLHDKPDTTQGKIVVQEYSKPSRPGRGAARLRK